MLLVGLFTTAFFPFMVDSQSLNNDESIYRILLLIMFGLGLAFSLPSLVAGYALLKRKTWARTAAIVAGILATPGFPHGTALGVYTLWFMFDDEGKALYANNAARAHGYQSALPGALVAGEWANAQPQNRREREYVPPPQMPNWH